MSITESTTATNHVLALLKEAQVIASKDLGIPNILQPGIIKELIIASSLRHELIPQKDKPDARDRSGNTYEYLASINRVGVKANRGCSFQIDRVTPENLSRVSRNAAFYFGVFKTHLELDEIWRVDTHLVLREVERQIAGSKNQIGHANFLLHWVKGERGTSVSGILHRGALRGVDQGRCHTRQYSTDQLG